VSQQNFAAAITCEADFFHNLSLLGLGDRRAVKVGSLSIGIALEFLKALLIMEPLVGQKFATVHTPDRNDHCYFGLPFPQIDVKFWLMAVGCLLFAFHGSPILVFSG